MANVNDCFQYMSHDMQIAQEWGMTIKSWLLKSASNSLPGDCKIVSLKKCCRLL